MILTIFRVSRKASHLIGESYLEVGTQRKSLKTIFSEAVELPLRSREKVQLKAEHLLVANQQASLSIFCIYSNSFVFAVPVLQCSCQVK